MCESTAFAALSSLCETLSFESHEAADAVGCAVSMWNNYVIKPIPFVDSFSAEQPGSSDFTTFDTDYEPDDEVTMSTTLMLSFSSVVLMSAIPFTVSTFAHHREKKRCSNVDIR